MIESNVSVAEYRLEGLESEVAKPDGAKSAGAMKDGEEIDAIVSGDEDSEFLRPAPPGWGYRHVLALLAFFGFFNVYCLRVNLSVAMVEMAKGLPEANNTSSNECPGPLNHTSKTTGEFDWSETTQDQILGAFFYGYIVTQLPGGWLAEKFGGKYLLGVGVLGTAVLTLLTPVAARLGEGVFIALRVVEGIGEGVTFPAMHAMWGKWGPIWERSKLTTFTYSGAQMGTVFAMPISGLLCQYGFAGGWPSVFYIFGTVACLWFFIWTWLIHSTPGQHPHISTEEREYIESGVGKKEDLAVPWKDIFTSRAVWVICVANFCNNWGFYVMLTTLPSYMKNILKFDIKTNGVLSAMPYLGCFIGFISSGFIADFLRSRGILSTTATRKLLTGIGLFTPALLLICVQFAGCQHAAVVAILTLALTGSGLSMGGWGVNHIDISPNFAGILMGLSNTFGTIPGFAGPAVVGLLTDTHDTRAQWQIVFYIASAIYTVGGIVFVALAEGDVKPWNHPAPRGVSFTHNNTAHTVQKGSVNNTHNVNADS